MDNVRTMRPKGTPGPAKGGRVRRRRIIIGVIVVAVIVVLAVSGRLLGLYVNWLWFGEVGFRSVFWTRLWWQVLVGLCAFALFFVVVFPNVELARRLAPELPRHRVGRPARAAQRAGAALGGMGRPGRVAFWPPCSPASPHPRSGRRSCCT